MTYGAIYQNTGRCEFTATLPSEVAYWNKHFNEIESDVNKKKDEM